MENEIKNTQARGVMQVIQNTPTTQIGELDLVKKKFIQNYNATHRDQAGELIYHRQLVFLKQILSNSEDLRNSDPFSLYACFVTVAVRGYSLDPEDSEVYIIPRGGKAYLQRQAGAYVRRLMQTNQIKYADQPRFVYQGDEFEVESGRVTIHKERFQSDNIVAAYIRMVIDDKGCDRYFIYRKSDWEDWKKKSPQKNGGNWTGNNGQPTPGFLRTKIVLHACKEKCWAIGVLPVNVEAYEDVEIDVDEDVTGKQGLAAVDQPASNTQLPASNTTPPPVNGHKPQQGNSNDFTEPPNSNQSPSVVYDDDTF